MLQHAGVCMYSCTACMLARAFAHNNERMHTRVLDNVRAQSRAFEREPRSAHIHDLPVLDTGVLNSGVK